MIINLTPHRVNIFLANGSITSIPSSGVARVNENRECLKYLSIEENTLVPIYKSVLGKVEGLPQPEPDVAYIVSRVVAAALPERQDLIYPHDIVRDREGRIIACKSFAVI